MATLQLNNLSKRYGKTVWGAKDINLSVDDKEFIVLLGPSGCGKTTTMRMIAGLEEVTQGIIYIDEKDVTFLPPRKRDISMVFQSYAVWPHLTVFDNIAFPLRLKKLRSSEIDKRVKEVSNMTKIEEYLERYPRQLSGGQRQRVALARALVVNPKVFLMDEPLSNLDAKLRVKMRTEMKAIHKKTLATTVFVTHDQAEAMSMADRIVIMKDGSIVQMGTTDDVYFDCEDMFVAGFIGTPPTNFLSMEITQKQGKLMLVNSAFSFEPIVENQEILKGFSAQKVIMGVRPESMQVFTEKTSNSVFSREVLVTEPQGSHQIVAIELDESIVKIVAPPFPKVEAGDIVHIGFEHDRLMFFDPETKKRIRKR